jgi:hypothetical protein
VDRELHKRLRVIVHRLGSSAYRATKNEQNTPSHPQREPDIENVRYGPQEMNDLLRLREDYPGANPGVPMNHDMVEVFPQALSAIAKRFGLLGRE